VDRWEQTIGEAKIQAKQKTVCYFSGSKLVVFYTWFVLIYQNKPGVIFLQSAELANVVYKTT
jgi:hypothetical protein